MDVFAVLQKANFTSPDFSARGFLTQFLKKYGKEAEHLGPAIDKLKADTDYLQKKETGTDLSTIIAASRSADFMGHSVTRLNGLIANCVACQARLSELSQSCAQVISTMQKEQVHGKMQGVSDELDEAESKIAEPKAEPMGQPSSQETIIVTDAKDDILSLTPLVSFRNLEAQVRLCIAENRLVQAYVLLQLAGTLDFSQPIASLSNSVSMDHAILSISDLISRASTNFDIPDNQRISVRNLENQLKHCFVTQASNFLLTGDTTTFDSFRNSLIFKQTRSFNIKDTDSINSHHITILNDYMTIFTRPSEAEKTVTADFKIVSGSESFLLPREDDQESGSPMTLQRTILRMIHYLGVGEAIVNIYLGGSSLYDCSMAAQPAKLKVFNYRATDLTTFEVNFVTNVDRMKDSINRALIFINLLEPYTDAEIVHRLNSKVFLWAQDTISKICAQLTSSYKSFLTSYTPSILQQSFSSLNDILKQTYDLLTSDLFTGLGLATHFRKTITGLISSLLSATAKYFELSDLCAYRTYEYSIITKEVDDVFLTFYQFLPVTTETIVQLNNGFTFADGYWHDHRINKRSSANTSRPSAVKPPGVKLTKFQTFPYLNLLLCIEQLLPFHDLLGKLLVTVFPDLIGGDTSSTMDPSGITTQTDTELARERLSTDVFYSLSSSVSLENVLEPFVRVKSKDAPVQMVTLLNTVMPIFDIVTATLSFIKSIYISYANLIDFKVLVPDLRRIFSGLTAKIMEYMVAKLDEVDMSLAGIERAKSSIASQGIASAARNVTEHQYNYGYALISSICFMIATVIPSSANNLRSILKRQLDPTTINDYFFVLRDLYRCSSRSLQSVIEHVSTAIIKDVLSLPELAQVFRQGSIQATGVAPLLPSTLTLKIAATFNSSLARFASAMPYLLMAFIGRVALQALADAFKTQAEARADKLLPCQLQVDLSSIVLANNSPLLKSMFGPLIGPEEQRVASLGSRGIVPGIENELFTFLSVLE
ncbi:Hypothetical protein GLP15_3967 [Giardia lamblia P15]|uniref:Uncharacterized protein n=1 Tax=Giardia intestinalis (strain P15) TaxID=658858 RepID=E1F9G1_GIAIA|nr:Hypothetical protein GLP15_3967 [Giardia lamblia P15]